ncbi:MAG: hypothetical protein JW395_0766 [Nitrospira sp.]|nr:hypothetical protein [Nitrospira sp.]
MRMNFIVPFTVKRIAFKYGGPHCLDQKTDFIRETGNASFSPLSRVVPSAQRRRALARRSEADGTTRDRRPLIPGHPVPAR